MTDSRGVFDADTGQSFLPFDEPAGTLCAILSVQGWRAPFDAARARGDVAQAQAIVEGHLRVHTEDSTAWFESAGLHHLRGALDSAARAYERAVEGSCGPQRARGLFNLGVVHEDAGRDDCAGQAYADALALLPRFADAHFNAARVWERLGDRWRALRHLHAYRRFKR